MKIGELANATETDRQTIRYYERIGVLTAPQRDGSGYRSYPSQSANEIRFIKRAKAAGFTLAEIRTLIGLADGRISRCTDVRRFVEEKLARVREQLTHLTAIEAGLEQLVGRCKRSETVGDCPALRSLLDAPGDQGK